MQTNRFHLINSPLAIFIRIRVNMCEHTSVFISRNGHLLAIRVPLLTTPQGFWDRDVDTSAYIVGRRVERDHGRMVPMVQQRFVGAVTVRDQHTNTLEERGGTYITSTRTALDGTSEASRMISSVASRFHCFLTHSLLDQWIVKVRA